MVNPVFGIVLDERTAVFVGIIIFGALMIAGMCKIYIKAGQPWWAVVIPLYCFYVALKIGCKSGWWLLLVIIPIISPIGLPIILMIIAHGISNRFHKGTGFTLGLIFLPFIFYPILGFGDAVYEKY